MRINKAIVAMHSPVIRAHIDQLSPSDSMIVVPVWYLHLIGALLTIARI